MLRRAARDRVHQECREAAQEWQEAEKRMEQQREESALREKQAEQVANVAEIKPR
eukprot:gene5345-5751_t